MLNNYLIPLIVVLIISYAFIKRVNIYESFTDGVVNGLKIVVAIIPAMLAMVFAINIFIGSNFLVNLFGKNSEILSMVFLRPISGNATLSVLNKIYELHGPDSFIGLLASVIQGATDTTIYVLALYFGSVKILKSRYALWVGLSADLLGILAAFIIAGIMF